MLTTTFYKNNDNVNNKVNQKTLQQSKQQLSKTVSSQLPVFFTITWAPTLSNNVNNNNIMPDSTADTAHDHGGEDVKDGQLTAGPDLLKDGLEQGLAGMEPQPVTGHILGQAAAPSTATPQLAKAHC